MKIRLLTKTLGLTALTVVAFCAIASAAQANTWLIQHSAVKTAQTFNHSGSIKLEVKARNLELTCSESGLGTVWPISNLKAELPLANCKATQYEQPTKPIPCTVKVLNTGSLEGTAESATVSAITFEMTGAECALPKNNIVKGITLQLSYGSEAKALSVTGSATSGTFGAVSLTTALTSSWSVGNNRYFGWGEPTYTGEPGHFYVGGKLLEGTATVEKAGSVNLETPARNRFISCSENSVAELGTERPTFYETHLSKCVASDGAGKELPCTIEPVFFTSKYEKFLIKANGPECTLPVEQLYLVPGFSYAYGSEAINLANLTWGSTPDGAYTMYWESTGSWKLTDVGHSGKTLGFH